MNTRCEQFSKCSLFFALLFVVAASASSTSIVVLRNDSEVVAGSDSRSRDIGKFRAPSGPACKVQRLGDLFWEIDGPAIDLTEPVRQAGGDIQSLRKTVEAFSNQAAQGLESAFGRLSQEEFDEYRKTLNPGGMDVVFFKMQSGVPVVAMVSLQIDFLGVGRGVSVHLSKKEILDQPRCPNFPANCGFIAGSNRAIAANQANEPRGFSIVDTVRRDVQLEIDDPATNGSVGPPIRILKLGKDGPHWIQNSNGCKIGRIPNGI